MRLLNTFTGRFELHDDPTKVRYAILSHTWSKDGEQSYQDVLALQEAAQAREAIVARASESLLSLSLASPAVAGRTQSRNDAPSASGPPPGGIVYKQPTGSRLRQVPITTWFHRMSKLDRADNGPSPNHPGGTHLNTSMPDVDLLPQSLSPPRCDYDSANKLTKLPGTKVDTSSESSLALPATAFDASPVPHHVDSLPVSNGSAAAESDPRVALFFSDPALSAKTRGACKIARQHGYRFIWIDACCIDKTSSAELSEAINSMFLWYTLADVCFVYMADVPHSLDGPQTGWESAFRESRWHTRGWTLQELIAPEYMLFLDSEWSVIGSKMELASTLAEITGVDEAVLVHAVPVNRISVLDRMRWASERETTRVEDEAYCLMGLFGIHMPTIYGEGRKAFIRLQQEIIKTIPDQSVFLWRPDYDMNLGPHWQRDLGTDFLLADSPSAYRELSRITVIEHKDFRALFDSPDFPNPIPSTLSLADCTFTANGARIRLPCIDLSAAPRIFSEDCEDECVSPRWLALLACSDAEGRIWALPLRRSPGDGPYLQVGSHNGDCIWASSGRLTSIARVDFYSVRPHVSMQEVCIRAYQSDVDVKHYWILKQRRPRRIMSRLFEPFSPESIVYASECVDTLRRQGFTLSSTTLKERGQLDIDATISKSLHTESGQCIHIHFWAPSPSHATAAPWDKRSGSLQLRHFFACNPSSAAEREDEHVPASVRALLHNPQEVHMRRASGPPLSPVAWVSAEDDSSHREKYQRFDLPGPYYQAEVLLRTESPGIDSPNFKARILRINFQIVDVPVVPLYAGPHLHSADESAVNKVLSIRVELSEPIALFRPVPQLPIWGRGNDEESEQEDEESDEDYDQSDEKDDENDEKDDESDEEDEEDGEANANRMLDEDPNTEEQESKAEQVWTRLRKWTWRASRRIRGGVVRVWRDNQRARQC